MIGCIDQVTIKQKAKKEKLDRVCLLPNPLHVSGGKPLAFQLPNFTYPFWPFIGQGWLLLFVFGSCPIIKDPLIARCLLQQNAFPTNAKSSMFSVLSKCQGVKADTILPFANVVDNSFEPLLSFSPPFGQEKTLRYPLYADGLTDFFLQKLSGVNHRRRKHTHTHTQG